MTVAVVDPSEAVQIEFNEKDFRIDWFSGTGCGGQFRNKHQNSCRMVHIESGLIVTAQCRSRQNSLEQAKKEMMTRLQEQSSKSHHGAISKDRKQQVGSGMRGDKIRTYQFKYDVVNDHQTGKSAKCSKVLAGHFDLLWS